MWGFGGWRGGALSPTRLATVKKSGCGETVAVGVAQPPHAKLVADVHPELKHTAISSALVTLRSTEPNFSPSILTRMPSLAGAFEPLKSVPTGASNVYTLVKVERGRLRDGLSNLALACHIRTNNKSDKLKASLAPKRKSECRG